MAPRDRSFFQQGVNMYVPAMAYAEDLLHGAPTLFNLGTPAASSATKFLTAVNAQAAALTEVAVAAAAQQVDSTYGRTLIVTPSGDPGNSFAQDVYGQDYVGQPMIERFTGASGSTAVLYGKKAFFRVLKVRNITSSTNAITTNIGTGTRLGLPYRGDLSWAKENNLWVPIYKRDQTFGVNFAVADAVTGASQPIITPFPGFVKNAIGSGTATGTAGNSVETVSLGGVAITGLSLNIPNNSAAFNTANPSTPGYSANNRFVANAPVIVLIAALASAKGVFAGVTLTPTQFLPPDLTDPATNVTGDPRGTYEALQTLDGASPIVVALVGDTTVNANNNGGLLGIKHFFA